ncbi:MAG TPA: hypothetical protein VJJ47_02025 [Candidatus Paceibacterota bacterium]
MKKVFLYVLAGLGVLLIAFFVLSGRGLVKLVAQNDAAVSAATSTVSALAAAWNPTLVAGFADEEFGESLKENPSGVAQVFSIYAQKLGTLKRINNAQSAGSESLTTLGGSKTSTTVLMDLQLEKASAKAEVIMTSEDGGAWKLHSLVLTSDALKPEGY